MKTVAPTSEQLTRKAEILSAFEMLEKTVAGSDTPLLRRLRSAAIARFSEEGFPGNKDEEWRFTSLASFYARSFKLMDTAQASRKTALSTMLTIPEAHRVTCYNGIRQPSLTELSGLPRGCTVLSLHDALKTMPDKVEAALDRQAHQQGSVFAALNTAFLQDGIFIHLGHECVVEQPIHLAFVESGDGTMCFPRMLVLAERHSQATIVETYQSLANEADLCSAVSEFVLADEAQIDHYRLNFAAESTFHFVSQHVKQSRGSRFRSHAFTLGGGLVRNDLFAQLGAENCETTLNGLYTADGNRLVDNHTTIDHAMPYCNSHEVYKGIISDKGKGVFNGKIFVRQDAQKTDAKQTNQTLLLSADATIDTKPQLEIFADDVKCTHGATVGQLDSEMLFYLKSRGIGPEEAQSILTYAFANDIIGRVEVPLLREWLESRFLQQERLV